MLRARRSGSANYIRFALPALVAFACTPAAADQIPPPPTAVSTAGPAVISAGTLVALRIDENLTSRTAKRGDKFSITLMNDLWLENRIAVPAGTKGVGEVIHAAGRGFGGRAGELIVTARYLEHEGNQLRLGHFRLGVAGADNATAAMLATAAVPIVGVFVTGTSATIGLGQLAQAKLAEDFQITAESSSSAAPSRDAEIQGGQK